MGQSAAVNEANFHPAARAAIRSFPDAARRAAGQAIWQLQEGRKLTMPLVRSLHAIGKGVEELRLREAAGQYRVFYYLKSHQGVLVLHAFAKKTQRAPDHEIELGRRRLRELLDA